MKRRLAREALLVLPAWVLYGHALGRAIHRHLICPSYGHVWGTAVAGTWCTDCEYGRNGR